MDGSKIVIKVIIVREIKPCNQHNFIGENGTFAVILDNYRIDFITDSYIVSVQNRSFFTQYLNINSSCISKQRFRSRRKPLLNIRIPITILCKRFPGITSPDTI